MKLRAYAVVLLGLLAFAMSPAAACSSTPPVSKNQGSGEGGFGNPAGAGGDGGVNQGTGGGPNDSKVVTQIAAGYYYTCARFDDGSIRCWGRGTAELGYGRGIGTEQSFGDNEPASATGRAPAGGSVAHLAVGGSTCVVFDDGSARCWGSNAYGELGNGTTDPIGDDETPASVTVAIALDGRAAQIDVGANHTCALLNDGTVRCWGANDSGQLGYVGVSSLLAPATAVDLGADVKATQIALGEKHSCALLDDGSARCWGAGTLGRLGYGNAENVGDNEVPSAAGPLTFAAKATQIGAGSSHSCARLEDGSVRCWGANGSGQLGYVGVSSLLAPAAAVDLGAGVKATQIALGSNHTCALLDDKTIRCWGTNDRGQLGYGHKNNLGDNESPSTASAVDVGGPVAKITAGFDHTCALLEDGSVRCWGGNEFGQLGYGNVDAIGDNESPASAGPVPIFLNHRPTTDLALLVMTHEGDRRLGALRAGGALSGGRSGSSAALYPAEDRSGRAEGGVKGMAAGAIRARTGNSTCKESGAMKRLRPHEVISLAAVVVASIATSGPPPDWTDTQELPERSLTLRRNEETALPFYLEGPLGIYLSVTIDRPADATVRAYLRQQGEVDRGGEATVEGFVVGPGPDVMQFPSGSLDGDRSTRDNEGTNLELVFSAPDAGSSSVEVRVRVNATASGNDGDRRLVLEPR